MENFVFKYEFSKVPKFIIVSFITGLLVIIQKKPFAKLY